MKRKLVEINEKDIEILNKIKKFLNKPNSDVSDKEIAEFCKTVKWINREFFTSKNSNQKMGHGKMRGLSGCTWDFSKMPADEARYMRECLQRDIEHDKMMNPMKYFGCLPIKNRPEKYEWERIKPEHFETREERFNRLLNKASKRLLEIILEIIDNEKQG